MSDADSTSAPTPSIPSDSSAEATDGRLALARIWLFGTLLYGAWLALTVKGFARSDAVFWGSLAVGAMLGVALFFLSGLPARTYGLTRANAGASLLRACKSSGMLILMGGLALAGFALAGASPEGPWLTFRPSVDLVAYVLIAAPLQELIYRGLFQTAARVIFGRGRAATAWAIAFSTICYALSHLSWGLGMVAAMSIPGAIWGVQAERDRNLLGVTLSHMVVGYLFVGVTPLFALLAR